MKNNVIPQYINFYTKRIIYNYAMDPFFCLIKIKNYFILKVK